MKSKITMYLILQNYFAFLIISDKFRQIFKYNDIIIKRGKIYGNGYK